MPVTRTLPSEWYDTPNIHLCTNADFERLCEQKGIEILERSVVNRKHNKTLLAHSQPWVDRLPFTTLHLDLQGLTI
ncbi:methionine biosynthesis protein MetW [Candidatus Reidiella endopervernicosa]|uniref:methionine biosynthesis protein MetW n=1 Tax=Candidatus Reidiella endopervernicosa TaxID=2738883 RepID=UPI00235126C3|nr:methionine biosynthesis protein MetW [Candidatus Reidiella endopervernicosa]